MATTDEIANDDVDVPETGAVFTFGRSKFADNVTNKFWIKNDPIVTVACGDEHSAVVTASGRLYTFGSNDWGQLGHGNTKTYYKPGFVRSLKHEVIRLVACGRSHTIAATETGRLYAFGAGGEGQLGLDDFSNYASPKLIEGIGSQDYALVSCGTEHSAALTKEGALYVWGSNSDGQLGVDVGADSGAPVVLDVGFPIKHASCGYYHTGIVTKNGRLYVCGENDSGKLGLGDDTSPCEQPRIVRGIDEEVESVSCGNAHTIVCTVSGRLYSFGEGSSGQLGLSTGTLSSSEPVLVDALTSSSSSRVIDVKCGESHSACVTDGGFLLTFGSGRHGKLGHGQENLSNLFCPTRVERFSRFHVQKVACGGCHMLVSAVPRGNIVAATAAVAAAPVLTSAETSVDPLAASQSLASARHRRRSRELSQGPLSPLQPLGRTLPKLSSLGLKEEIGNGSEAISVAAFSKPKLPDISVANNLSEPLLPEGIVRAFKPEGSGDDDVPEVSEESGLSESEEEEEDEAQEEEIGEQKDEKDKEEADGNEEAHEEEENEEEQNNDDHDDKKNGVKVTDQEAAENGNGTAESSETKDTEEPVEKQSKFSKLFFWKKKKTKRDEGEKTANPNQPEAKQSSVCSIL